MKPIHVFLFIFVVYILGFFAHALYLKKTVYGDGIYYFSWVQSIIVDHRLPPLPIKHAVGPALLWVSPFVITHQIVRGTGYELPYQLTLGFTSVLYALFGLILLYRLLCQFFSTNASIFTTVAIAFATNLLFYGSLDTVNSHGVSFFAGALFLAFVMNRQSVSAGLALGFLGAIRPQDLILGIIAFGSLQKKEWISFFTGTLIGFLPQLLAWQLLYGSFFNIPYFAHEGFNLLQPHVFEVLFSIKFGLFVYSPVILLSFIGLYFWKNRLRWPFYLAIVLELLLISSWSTWWQGASYGGRMFVSSLPLFAFGIANVFSWLSRLGCNEKIFFYILLAPLSLLNLLLIIRFLLIT